LGFLVWSGGGGFGVRSRRRLVGCSVVAPAEERSVRLALGKLKVEVLPEPLKFSSSWRTMVETLESMGLTGTRLSKLLRKRPALLELDPMETVIPFVRTVTTVLDYDTKGASILLCKRPSLMDYPEIAVAEVLSILLSLGIEERPLRFLLLRFPGIAEINPSQVRSSLRYLVKDAGFKINELWPLIRDSPWVMCYDVETECTPVIEFLEEIGVQNVKLIIQTEPRVWKRGTNLPNHCSVNFASRAHHGFLDFWMLKGAFDCLCDCFPRCLDVLYQSSSNQCTNFCCRLD